MNTTRSILIAGPTASGKSALALALARTCGGTIINADSMQVYRELRILTARPTVHDEAAVPHRLYGHVGVADGYSAAHWLTDVQAAIADVRKDGRTPIIVGGTGLYFMALTQGLSPIPSIPEEIRRHWRQTGLQTPAAELHLELRRRDPVTAERIRDSDRQRIVRALEVFEATGKPLAEWQDEPGTPVLEAGDYLGLVVDLPRADLYTRADRRFGAMMKQGAQEEAERVRQMQLAPDLPAMRALGLAPLIAHIEGAMTLDEAREQSCRDTRHYIKRQLTWLRRNMIAWKWLGTHDMQQIETDGFGFID